MFGNQNTLFHVYLYCFFSFHLLIEIIKKRLDVNYNTYSNYYLQKILNIVGSYNVGEVIKNHLRTFFYKLTPMFVMHMGINFVLPSKNFVIKCMNVCIKIILIIKTCIHYCKEGSCLTISNTCIQSLYSFATERIENIKYYSRVLLNLQFIIIFSIVILT